MQHNTSQSETLTLVTVEDLTPICQRCSHQDGAHGPGGCRYATWENGPCSCKEPASRVVQRHWTRVVRREMAKELEQLAQDEAEDMLSEADYGPDATVYRAVTVASILERAEAIRHG